MSNILFLFEGKVTENNYYKVIERAIGSNIKSSINFYCYKTNIYTLYDEISNDSALNIIELVKEKALIDNDIENYEMLNTVNFGEIYLIFDLDPQDQRFDKNKIEKMIEIFNNETENGKLYINYPMIESFKHFKEIPDKNYIDYKVKILDCKNYKKDVAKISCINDYRKISKEQYINILNQNLEKINYLINRLNKCDFDTYLNTLGQSQIFFLQENEIDENGQLYIINSFCLWPLDYLGEKFFDDVIINGKRA